jgi:hypothetical protein
MAAEDDGLDEGVTTDYVGTAYCPFCRKDTEQKFHDAGHERDSSYDTKTCTVCGARHMGMTGEYHLGSEYRR